MDDSMLIMIGAFLVGYGAGAVVQVLADRWMMSRNRRMMLDTRAKLDRLTVAMRNTLFPAVFEKVRREYGRLKAMADGEGRK